LPLQGVSILNATLPRATANPCRIRLALGFHTVPLQGVGVDGGRTNNVGNDKGSRPRLHTIALRAKKRPNTGISGTTSTIPIRRVLRQGYGPREGGRRVLLPPTQGNLNALSHPVQRIRDLAVLGMRSGTSARRVREWRRLRGRPCCEACRAVGLRPAFLGRPAGPCGKIARLF